MKKVNVKISFSDDLFFVLVVGLDDEINMERVGN